MASLTAHSGRSRSAWGAYGGRTGSVGRTRRQYEKMHATPLRRHALAVRQQCAPTALLVRVHCAAPATYITGDPTATVLSMFKIWRSWCAHRRPYCAAAAMGGARGDPSALPLRPVARWVFFQVAVRSRALCDGGLTLKLKP